MNELKKHSRELRSERMVILKLCWVHYWRIKWIIWSIKKFVFLCSFLFVFISVSLSHLTEFLSSPAASSLYPELWEFLSVNFYFYRSHHKMKLNFYSFWVLSRNSCVEFQFHHSINRQLNFFVVVLLCTAWSHSTAEGWKVFLYPKKDSKWNCKNYQILSERFRVVKLDTVCVGLVINWVQLMKKNV